MHRHVSIRHQGYDTLGSMILEEIQNMMVQCEWAVLKDLLTGKKVLRGGTATSTTSSSGRRPERASPQSEADAASRKSQ